MVEEELITERIIQQIMTNLTILPLLETIKFRRNGLFLQISFTNRADLLPILNQNTHLTDFLYQNIANAMHIDCPITTDWILQRR
jgi:hypothetical protein